MPLGDYPFIHKITAGNASAMTSSGTNSYIISHESEWIVIDPGPEDTAHQNAMVQRLSPKAKSGKILLTHMHLDHSAGAAALAKRTGAMIFAHPLANLSGGILGDDAFINTPYGPLRAIHTPGHAPEHLCFALGDVLFSGDHAMGWASSAVLAPEGNMQDYLRALERLLQFKWRLILAGHGPDVENPQQRLIELRDHRLMRSKQIVALLSKTPASAQDISAHIYQEHPNGLQQAARLTVLAHLIALQAEGRAKCADELPQIDSTFYNV